MRICGAWVLIRWKSLLVKGEIVKSSYSRLEPETCLDPKPSFNTVRDDDRCVVSKIEVDGEFTKKKESMLNRVFQYASRLVA